MPSRGLGSVATVVDGAQPVRMRRISEDLGAHGVARLMVEGGGKVHTKFLIANLVDELHPCAPRSFGARPGSSAGAQRSTAAQRRSRARTDCSTLSPCQPDRTTSQIGVSQCLKIRRAGHGVGSSLSFDRRNRAIWPSCRRLSSISLSFRSSRMRC
jgi:hypothetical protein